MDGFLDFLHTKDCRLIAIGAAALLSLFALFTGAWILFVVIVLLIYLLFVTLNDGHNPDRF